MAVYSIRLDGDTRAMLRRIRSFSEIDKQGINAALAEGARESTLERFKQSKGPDGRRWKTSIRAAQEGGKTLIQSAQLRNSIHDKSDASGFAVGTNVKYAATHQFGEPGRTIRARKKKALRFQVGGKWVTKKQVRITIPARPFLGLSEDEIAIMDGGRCILQLRGVRPFFSEKFDITKHPHYKYLADADKKNTFDVDRFLSTLRRKRQQVVAQDEGFDLYEIDLSDENAAE